jgi:adenosylcobinamide-phosphate synthase
MAAGAGSLNVLLGGPAIYHGALETRPVLGFGMTASPQHVVAALRLVERTTLLWLAILLVLAFMGVGFHG